MPNGVNERAFNAMSAVSEEADIFGGEFGGIVEDIYKEMPVLRKYDFNVFRSSRFSPRYDPEKPREGWIEYWTRDDKGPSGHPNLSLGTRNIELYRNAPVRRAVLEKAILGDMLHALGKEDKEWRQMRKEYMQERTSADVALDVRTWGTRDEKRSYPDWMEQSRADAYIRGALLGDEQWLEGINPKQREIIGQMNKYLRGD